MLLFVYLLSCNWFAMVTNLFMSFLAGGGLTPSPDTGVLTFSAISKSCARLILAASKSKSKVHLPMSSSSSSCFLFPVLVCNPMGGETDVFSVSVESFVFYCNESRMACCIFSISSGVLSLKLAFRL